MSDALGDFIEANEALREENQRLREENEELRKFRDGLLGDYVTDGRVVYTKDKTSEPEPVYVCRGCEKLSEACNDLGAEVALRDAEVERLEAENELLRHSETSRILDLEMRLKEAKSENQNLRSRVQDTESVLHETACDRHDLLHERDDARAENQRLREECEAKEAEIQRLWKLRCESLPEVSDE